MAEDFKTARPLEYYKEFLKEQVRPDGRGLHEYRKTIVNINSISTADGSALVRVGNTKVVCGVKGELAEPSPERCKEGFFVPNVELPALCSNEFRPGPPSDKAQELSVFVADIVQNCNFINLEELCIQEKKLCWVINADIVCLSNDGNLFDAIITAFYAAVKNASFPVVSINEESGAIEVSDTECFQLNLSSRLSSATVQMFSDEVLLVDPSFEEENLSDGYITVVIGDDRKIFAVYKPGGCSVKDEAIRFCLQSAFHRANDIERLLLETTECEDR